VNRPLPLAKTHLRISYTNGGETPADIDYLLGRVLQYDDYRAFEKLFHANYTPLRNFSKRLVKINEVAEELVSEVFSKIWSGRKRIVISSSAKSYLYTSVRNISFDYLRREKHALWSNLEDADFVTSDSLDPHRSAEFVELQTKVDLAVAKLPRQCRLVFQLSRDEGMKYNDIADTLCLSVKTIETQIGRALKSLRTSLKNDYIHSL
jgi:RNA polymerase sigma-70 factor, ECF subfamily